MQTGKPRVTRPRGGPSSTPATDTERPRITRSNVTAAASSTSSGIPASGSTLLKPKLRSSSIVTRSSIAPAISKQTAPLGKVVKRKSYTPTSSLALVEGKRTKIIGKTKDAVIRRFAHKAVQTNKSYVAISKHSVNDSCLIQSVFVCPVCFSSDCASSPNHTNQSEGIRMLGSCGHCVCAKCALSIYNENPRCPMCNALLSKKDFVKIFFM